MNCMDENPYQSPKAVPEVEKRPVKPPNRYSSAAVCGFLGAIGPFILLSSFLGPFMSSVEVPLYMTLPMALAIFFVPGTVGLAMARWAWCHPESKWVFPVACLLGMSGYIPFLIGILFFGLR